MYLLRDLYNKSMLDVPCVFSVVPALKGDLYHSHQWRGSDLSHLSRNMSHHTAAGTARG